MPEWKRTLTPPSSSSELALVPSNKRPRTDAPTTDLAVVGAHSAADKRLLKLHPDAPARTSRLQSPIMLLSGGHAGDVYTAKFHTEGEVLASSGSDQQVCLWHVYDECDNYHVVPHVHSAAVLELHFGKGDPRFVYTASVDKTVGIVDVEVGVRLKRLKGHTSYVNSCFPARRGDPLICSGSDDCSVKVWDQRKRAHIHHIDTNYQVTAVSFNDTADSVVCGGIDNMLKVFDLRNTKKASLLLHGHSDTITGLALSPDGSRVATNAMDNTIRIFDVRPYAKGDRCLTVMRGHQHNFEKNLLRCAWSKDGKYVAAGSADRNVYVWEAASGRIKYKLPGHLGSVNDVDFHPFEPIVLSASSDKQIFLGEYEP